MVITDKHQASAGFERLQQRIEHQRVNHACLVNNHDIVRQRIAGVVTEGVGIASVPEQPVQCARLQCGKGRSTRRREYGEVVPQRLR